MGLEHALLVSLKERPAAGLELAHRFDRSIGFFWGATHQQIYKVLRRMEGDGWVTSENVDQVGKREKIVYTVTTLGEKSLAEWIQQTTPRMTLRSDIAVKMRGAVFGDRQALLENIAQLRDEHRTRLEYHELLRDRTYPDPSALHGQSLDQYLVLRGGLLIEQFWVTWLSEYLAGFEAQQQKDS